jgi:hypothetical protein
MLLSKKTGLFITATFVSFVWGGLEESVDPSSFLQDPGTPSRYRGAGNCTTPCDEDLEFCGTDQTCHMYSCANWYQWGPPECTGHILGAPVKIFSNQTMVISTETSLVPALECVDIVESVHGPSVIYGCAGWICIGDYCEGYSATHNPRTGIAQDFLRHCSARIGNLEYNCYDSHRESGGSDNTPDWDNFLVTVENSVVNCSNEYAPNPEFLYTVYLASPMQGVTTGSSTSTFNATHASATVHSTLDFVEDDDSGGIRLANHLTWLFLVGTLLWFTRSPK